MILPARIRFDDAIVFSDQFPGKEVQKFTKHINWCINVDVELTPAVLCVETATVRGAAEVLNGMIKEGLVYPDLHGWDHGPYQDRPLAEVREHLEKSQIWFKEKLEVPAIRWVTPHGSDSATMREAAAEFNLVIETTEHPVIDQKHLDTALRETWDLRVLEDRVVMVHFWERGLRLYRIARIIEHQSVEFAISVTRSELSERDHEICWGAWEAK